MADILIEMRVRAVFLSGGEPLIVDGLTEGIRRWASASVPVHLFTSGWGLDAIKVKELAPLLSAVHVSVDGITADVHDRIRNRPGSFAKAMAALEALNGACAALRLNGARPLQFGVDVTLIQSNFHQLNDFASSFKKRFPEIGFVNVGAAVPSGTASTPWFAANELLTEEQLKILRHGPSIRIPGTLVSFSDQRYLQMHPDDVAAGTANVDTLEIEPDGNARAMAMYEGTVGNIFVDSPETLWARAQQRWRDPFVERTLMHVRTRVEWAAATREIDARYGSDADLQRMKKRLTVLR